jgi:hypothetical protein
MRALLLSQFALNVTVDLLTDLITMDKLAVLPKGQKKFPIFQFLFFLHDSRFCNAGVISPDGRGGAFETSLVDRCTRSRIEYGIRSRCVSGAASRIR